MILTELKCIYFIKTIKNVTLIDASKYYTK